MLQWRGVFDRSLGLLHEGVELARRTHAGFLCGVAAFYLGNAYTARGAYEDAPCGISSSTTMRPRRETSV